MNIVILRFFVVGMMLMNSFMITAQTISVGSLNPQQINQLNAASSIQSNGGSNRAPNENIYQTDPSATTLMASIFSTPLSTAPKFGDKIRFTNTSPNRLITQVQVGLFHLSTDPKLPITLEISMYSDCPAPNSNTQGNACGTGPGTLIPGSTMTLPDFLPVDGTYLRDFNFPTPVNVYGYGDEITVMFKAISASNVYILNNTPILIGSNPIGEPSESRYSGCGANLNFSGCDYTIPGQIHNNILLNVVANEDTNPPTAQCKNVTATLHPILGTVNVPASAINNGSFDGEGSVTLSSSKTSFNCSNVGPNTVTLTVTDRAGFTSTCTAIVTIQESPIVMGCPADKVFEANNANCTYQFSFSDIITGNQSCNPVTITQIGGPPNNSFLPIGDTVFTYQGTTPSGLTATCSYTVTIIDTNPPVISNCPANITVNAGPGACGAVVNYTAPTVNDNCLAFFAQVQGLASGSSFPVGTTTNTWVAADFGGNQVDCSFTVTVIDTTPPSITCNFSTVNAQNDPGQCTRTVVSTAFNPIVSDNCSSVIVTNDFTNTNTLVGAALPVGQTIVTWTAEDINGNTSTCATTFFVTDAEDPQISCSSDITVSTDPGACGAIVTFPDPSVSDNCGISSPAFSQTFTYTGNMQTFTVPIGVTSINIEAWGASGQGVTVEVYNPSTGGLGGYAQGELTVTPGQVLNLFVGGTGMEGAGGYNGGATGGFGIAGSGATDGYAGSGGGASDVRMGGTDLLSRIIVAGGGGGGGRDYVNGTCQPCGEGGNGGAGGGATGVDGQDPTDPNFGFYFNPGAGGKGGTQATGGAGGDGPQGPNGNPGTLGIGGIGIDGNFTIASGGGGGGYYGGGSGAGASNGSGVAGGGGAGGSSYTGGVLNGTTTPGVRSGNGEIIISWTTQDLTQTSGLPSGSVFPVGTTLNTFEVTDVHGNTASCSFTVTVEDTEPPVANCSAPFSIQLDTNGMASITVNDIENGSTDNCGIASTSIDVSSFDCSNVGNNNVTLTVTDVNGNSSSCTAIVTVEDNEAPQTVCQNITVQLDTNGNATVTAADVDGGSTDACGIASLAIDVDTFDCNNIGTNNVTLTVTDVNGNSSQCTAVVTVEDTVAPNALCQNITVSLDANGNASIVASDVDGGSSDACGIASTSIDVSSFDCSNVGTNNVTLTVTDVNGNSSSCTAIVTVEDTVAPVALCQNITVQLDASGTVTIDPALLDGGSIDACGIDLSGYSVDIDTFDCSNVGNNNVVLTITDVNGNSSSCTAIVTVEDTVAPNALCQNITVSLDANGLASIVASDVDGGSSDACGIASNSIDISSFDCSDLGPNNVTLTVTDVNGNSSSCNAIVTVVDNTPPVIVCPADVSVNTDAGLCSAVVSFADAIALDNCSASVAQTAGPSSGSAFPVGVSTIEFTATDAGGNTTLCSFTITVTDTTPPVVACQDITIQLDEFGNAAITAADVDGGTFDPCGLDTLSIDIDTFDCSNVGANNVTLTATDIHGNSSSCTAIVTVEDLTAPVALCQNITVQLDASGTVTIDPALLDGGSTDACGIDPSGYSVDTDTFDCSSIGDNNVTLTVTDVNGNTATCSAIVTVEDLTAPELVCQDITVALDANGEATIVPEDVIASNTDACGSTTTSLDIDFFTCDDIGAPVLVTVFSEDANGNIATCTATVTVEDVLGPQFDTGTLPVDVVRQADVNGEYLLEDFTVGITVTDNCSEPLLPIVIAQDPIVGTVLVPGIYDITLLAMDDLGNPTEYVFQLTVEEFLGTNGVSVDLSTIVLYPNPARATVNISNPRGIALQTARVYDATGRLVKAFDLTNMGTETALDVATLASATYLVVIQSEKGTITKQLVKE
ncbi:MAG: HYR domain-containing protein [Flavobacteriaceae bacterium]